MQKRAFIYDFDNTIFPVPSIGERLFAPLFNLIEDDGGYVGDFSTIKDAVMRQPFQAIAMKHNFSKQLTDKSIALLNDLSYDGPLTPFEDYEEVKKLPGDRYLVTTGFYKLQKSKIQKTYMVVGEGTIFLLLLLYGINLIRKANKKEHELLDQKNNFLLSITHELKTPLATTKLQLQTLKKHQLPVEKQQYQ